MQHRVVFSSDPNKGVPAAVVVDGQFIVLGSKGKLIVPVQPKGLITEITVKQARSVESTRRRD